MISQADSGLTLTQYNNLKSAEANATWSLTAHKYNLSFTETGDDQGRDNDLPDFDAVAYGDYIIRIVGDVLERYNTASATWEQASAYTGLGGAIDTDGSNLVVDGTDLFVFTANADGLYLTSTPDGGETFSSWSPVTLTSNINKIAAVNRNRIHYTVEDTDKGIFNMRVAKYDGSWSTSESDIWYTYPFSNFVAAELPDGSDMIVAATQVPGITTVKLVVNKPTKYIKQQGGIIGFHYSNNWWGDHYDIDVVDELTAYRFRDRIKLTQFSDRVALTCYSSDGTQLFPYTMYRMYTTVDGKYWSKGNALPLPSGFGTSGAKLVRLGDYVYAIERSRAYKSLMTLQLGYSPTVCQTEIPKRKITQLAFSESEMMQGSLVLSNEDGWLDSNTIISKLNRTLLVFKMGYWIGGEKVEVQTNMAEIDTYDMSESLPRHMVKLTFRDFMSWMTDINSAERPYYWDSQLIAGDDFIDTSNDKYGGLRHIEPQAGSFTSENSVLNLTSNNEEGVGFSTFSLYLWNGITQTQFKLSTVGNSEYAGCVFRGSDKDNFWTAYYNQTDDKIKLAERSGGVADIKVSSSTMGWSTTPTTARYIQVEFRYAHIIVRTSTDGITWTDRIDYLMTIDAPAATPDLQTLANSNKERGYVGFMGKGYAPPEVDTWDIDPLPYPDPDPYPEPTYNPPYGGYVPYTPALYPPTGSITSSGTNPKKIVMADELGVVFRATNLNAVTGTVTWKLVHDFECTIYSVLRDPTNSKQYWFATANGLYKIANVWANTPVAVQVASNFKMFGDALVYPNGIYMSEKKKTYLFVTCGNSLIAKSTNSGSTWTIIHPFGGSADPAQSVVSQQLNIPFGSGGTMYTLQSGYISGAQRWRTWRSLDWGETWTRLDEYVSVSISQPHIISPYRRSTTNAVNKVDMNHELIVHGGDRYFGSEPQTLARSTDGGFTWSDFTYSIGTPWFAQYYYPMTPYNNVKGYDSNTKNGKMAFASRRNAMYGGGGKFDIVYTTDGWANPSNLHVLPGYISDAVPFMSTWPNNQKFLVVGGRVGIGAGYGGAFTGAYGGGGWNGISVTADLGVTWYDIGPSHTATLYPIYVDVQA